MQIKIEIDVKPDELRRFLGLPDVAGLQDDVIRFLRDKVSAAGENFDPAAVVHSGLDLLKRSPAWRRLKGAIIPDDGAAPPQQPVKIVVETAAPAAAPDGPPKPPRRPRTPRKAAAKQRASRKASAKPRPSAAADHAPDT